MDALVHSAGSDHGVSLDSSESAELARDASQRSDDIAQAPPSEDLSANSIPEPMYYEEIDSASSAAGEIEAQPSESIATGAETSNLTLSAPAESEPLPDISGIISIEDSHAEEDKRRVKQLTIDEINRKYLNEVEVLVPEEEDVFELDISLAESTPEDQMFEGVFVSCDSQPTELGKFDRPALFCNQFLGEIRSFPVSTQTHPAENVQSEPFADAGMFGIRVRHRS